MTTGVSSAYSIRPAGETDIDTLVDLTRREAAEAERLTLSIEAATQRKIIVYIATSADGYIAREVAR
jgi:hypothetical protein